MDLHSAKQEWMLTRAAEIGLEPSRARRAVVAVDDALDRSSDSLVWSRGPLEESVERVWSGQGESTLDDGVALQRAYTDMVWDQVYGDRPSVAVVRHEDPSEPKSSTKLTSWSVSENRPQIDQRAERLGHTVMEDEVPRGEALMIPWGEGRYRSNYVNVKGEVLRVNPGQFDPSL